MELDLFLAQLSPVLGVFVALLHLAGLVAAVTALLNARTPQGAIAWSLFLVMFPLVALPAFLVFGERKFVGYVLARREGRQPLQALAQAVADRHLPTLKATFSPEERDLTVFENLAAMPFTSGNRARLLIDGEATFEAIFAGIDQARDYLLVQFYIVHDDGLGRALQQRLIARAKEGVRVLFMYDAIGSFDLPERYLQALRAAGVAVQPFHGRTHRNPRRYQLNFRNHRKIVVADGLRAWVGGHNVGDEYLGRDPKLSPWRDTHVEVHGPAALGVQLAFLEDWKSMTGEIPDLAWEVEVQSPGQRVLVLPSGPADELETCGLMFTEIIHMARKRLWIVSPYFVPDDTIVSALQLAALRGVDVRLMIPERADHRLVYMASFAYLEETLPVGIRIFRYRDGFLHQKAFLMDDALAGVGTANLDNRSFRLNFEIFLLFADRDFVRETEAMLEADFARCRELEMAEFASRPWLFRLGARIARLFAPVL